MKVEAMYANDMESKSLTKPFLTSYPTTMPREYSPMGVFFFFGRSWLFGEEVLGTFKKELLQLGDPEICGATPYRITPAYVFFLWNSSLEPSKGKGKRQKSVVYP